MDPGLEELARQIRRAARLTIMTGAGVSAASGIPTFRGSDGLWRSFRAEDLATPQAFHKHPETVWEWYDWRRTLIARASPNAAHAILAKWTRRDGVTLITQNVDGLHERAGAANVIRFHGSIWHLSCAAGCGAGEWEDHRAPLPDLPPRCPHCGGIARPAVVWFGEGIDTDVLERCEKALSCDVFLSIGTSSTVHPAAGLMHAARGAGAYTAEINPQATGARGLDLAIAMPAEIALPLIDVALA